MTDTITTTTPQLDWLLRTMVNSRLTREGAELPTSYQQAPHELGVRSQFAEPIVCANGATISVQTGRTNYCSPRDDNGPWLEVEVGFPSVDPGPDMCMYQDGEGNPTHSVYGYVPVKLVREFIKARGGERQ